MTVSSFEEFHAARRRQRAIENAVGAKCHEEKDRSYDTPSQCSPVASMTEPQRALLDRNDNTTKQVSLGKILESTEVQLMTVALIYLDVIASTFRLVLLQTINGTGTKENGSIMNESDFLAPRPTLRFIESFTEFTLFFFILEIAALAFAFRLRFLSHIGYCADAIILILCFVCEVSNTTKLPRMLGFLRVWRVARLVSTTITAANEQHEGTKANLQQVLDREEKLKSKVLHLEESSRSEISHRKQVEKMLEGYKEEAETLSEALKIAAHDIAAAGYESITGIKNSFVDEDGDEFFEHNN